MIIALEIVCMIWERVRDVAFSFYRVADSLIYSKLLRSYGNCKMVVKSLTATNENLFSFNSVRISHKIAFENLKVFIVLSN